MLQKERIKRLLILSRITRQLLYDLVISYFKIHPPLEMTDIYGLYSQIYGMASVNTQLY
jgi:hypothetical protein